MKNKRVTLQAKRIFSEEFKRQCVKEYESGQQTVQELGSLYGIKVQTIYRWIYRYSTYNKKKLRIVEMDESSTKKVKELQQRIKELERAVGQKQMQLDFFETMMEVAKDQLGLDIKKNFSTQASKSSGKGADDGTA